VSDGGGPTRHPAIETAVLGAEAVLYDERSGAVHHLNTSACAVWMLLDGRAADEIAERLSEETGVPHEDIIRDVVQVIADLQAAGLLAD
jgi:PqqD family protein of HPr-rel-A system